MKKEIRQAKIEQLINKKVIATQDDLISELEHVNIKATQATISRDIREMKIVKAQDEQGDLRYAIFKSGNLSEEVHLFEIIFEVVTNITKIQFMNVVKTIPSNGNLLAAIIDDFGFPDIVGTVAGHDTIMIISSDEQAAQRVYDIFTEHANPDNLI
ncbi:arginine repressor [Dellaglioa sp. P0083]|uniref:arginine repressor n=1 Tax=Dellaglioa kimchii TaxID=3344667 RepID=UPI0038D3AC92